MPNKSQNQIDIAQLQKILTQNPQLDPRMLTQKPKVSKFQKWFSNVLQLMQKLTHSLDQFINLIANKPDSGRSDAVQAARSPIVFGIYVILVFVVFGGTWSAIAPLNSAAVAIGSVVADSNKKTIQHKEGGIIKEIYVRQGDKVVAGDPLLALEDTGVKVEYENTLNQYRTLLANESRLIAERDGLEQIDFAEFLLKDNSPNIAKVMKVQENLFKSKKELFRAENESLKQRLSQLHKTIEGLEAKKLASKKTLEVIEDRLKATKELYKKNFVQKAALLEIESKHANAISEVAMTEIEIAKTRQEITKTEIDIIKLQSKYVNDALTELKDIQFNVSAAKEKLNNVTDSLNRIIIRSPVDGIVNHLRYHTIGGVVTTGQPILEISPVNDTLIIEAKVAQKNIDSVAVGLVAKIRFSAFKSRTTPLFTGKVTSISPDVVSPENGQADPNGPYYIARIEINHDEFNKFAKTKNIELHPGMQAEVQIVTGSRTLLRYLLDPVTDVMFRAFREK